MINSSKKTAVPEPAMNGLNLEHLHVLQDIDWHVADILRRRGQLPKEELVIALVDTVPHDTIKSTRSELFGCAHGIYTDIHGDDANTKPLQAKQRRGATATQAYARDLVELFYYIAGFSTGFPTDVLSTNCKLPAATDSIPNDQTRLQQSNTTSDSSSVTLNSASMLDTDMKQTIVELVVRCQDYDKIIIDMQCQINAAVDKINTLQAKLQVQEKTTDSITLQDSCLSSHSEQLLQRDGASQQHVDISHGPDSTDAPQETTFSYVDISASLTDLLMCSTPEKRNNKDTQTVNEALQLGTAEWCAAKEDEIDNVKTDIYILKETCKDMKHRMDAKLIGLSKREEKDSRDIRTLKKSAKRVNAELQSAKQQLDTHRDIISNIYETSENAVPSIPCSNRFEVLTQSSENIGVAQDVDQDTFTVVNTRRRKPRNRTASRKTPSRKEKTRVTIVGSSMVRGLGTMVCSDTIAACCFTNPGCRTDDVKDRIHQMTRPNDEVIVLACGTNNIPEDDVPTLTAKVDELIEDTRRMRPFAQIIVPEIPRRNDSAELNRKIDASNDSIERLCANYVNVHHMRQSFRYSDYSRDKLHLNWSGKEIYARNLRNKIAQVMSPR